jgi:uncharacterized membrane protein
MGFPFKCEPFYKRPFLTFWLVTGGFFKFLFYIVIPIALALFIIFVFVSVIVMILSTTFDWPYDSEQTERRRKEEKTEEETKQGKLNETVDKIGEDADKLAAPVRAGAALDTSDLKKRLEIELEILVEMVALRKERLEALEDVDVKDNASLLDLEVRSMDVM